jgi:hypothetical protein
MASSDLETVYLTFSYGDFERAWRPDESDC